VKKPSGPPGGRSGASASSGSGTARPPKPAARSTPPATKSTPPRPVRKARPAPEPAAARREAAPAPSGRRPSVRRRSAAPAPSRTQGPVSAPARSGRPPDGAGLSGPVPPPAGIPAPVSPPVLGRDDRREDRRDDRRDDRRGGYEPRRGRRVTRVVRRIEMWSVLKLSIVVLFCLYVAVLLALAAIWNIAYQTGQIERLQSFLSDVGLKDWRFYGDRMFRAAMAIGAVGVLAGSLLSVLFAGLVNVVSEITGGIRFTVIEEEPRRRR